MGRVEALLLTAGMLGLMGIGLVALARLWPRSSRHTGYRITGRGEPGGEEPPVPEDDDVRWDWRAGGH